MEKCFDKFLSSKYLKMYNESTFRIFPLISFIHIGVAHQYDTSILKHSQLIHCWIFFFLSSNSGHWQPVKMSLPIKCSHLWSQNNLLAKLHHTINAHIFLLTHFLLGRISRLRSMKISCNNKLFTHFIHFHIKMLINIPLLQNCTQHILIQ